MRLDQLKDLPRVKWPMDKVDYFDGEYFLPTNNCKIADIALIELGKDLIE